MVSTVIGIAWWLEQQPTNQRRVAQRLLLVCWATARVISCHPSHGRIMSPPGLSSSTLPVCGLPSAQVINLHIDAFSLAYGLFNFSVSQILLQG